MRDYPSAPCIALLVVALQIGCGTTPSNQLANDPQHRQRTEMTDKHHPRPADFAVQYDWREGSVPPPYHYEYTIRIGPGPEGTVVFVPDYPMHDPPVWKETFPVDTSALDHLYHLMAVRDTFRATWTELADPPVGGSLEWMRVTAAGKTCEVPSQIEETDTLADVYKAIRDLVPRSTWAQLMAKQQAFVRSHESQ